MDGPNDGTADFSKGMFTLLMLLAFPVLVMGSLLLFSPNYQHSDQPLAHPLGGDYLQEYVGGRILLTSGLKENLYEPTTFQAVQHDPKILDFEWDNDRFFPVVYPPFWYAAVSPLSRLEYLPAARVWLVLITACLVAAIVLLNRGAAIPALPLVGMCLSGPVIESLSSGQKGTLLLLILSASYLLLKRDQPFASGAVFALIAFKPHLGVPIGLFMLCSGKWRWVAGTLSSLAGLTVASLLVGLQLNIDYLNVCLGFGDYVKSGGYELEKSFSLWSAWQLLIADASIAKGLALVTSVGVLGASIGLLRKLALTHSDTASLSRSFAAMVIVTVVTAPHLYAYDLTMLLLPVGLLARVALRDSSGDSRWLSWAPVLLLLTVLFACDYLICVAAGTHVQAGVVMLLVALVLILLARNAAVQE